MYLGGVLGREYRKFESVILAGFGTGKHREEVERPPEGLSERGERGELVLIETLLWLLGWHLFPVPCCWIWGRETLGRRRKPTGEGCQGGGGGENRCLSSVVYNFSVGTCSPGTCPTCPPAPVPLGHLSRIFYAYLGGTCSGGTCSGAVP